MGTQERRDVAAKIGAVVVAIVLLAGAGSMLSRGHASPETYAPPPAGAIVSIPSDAPTVPPQQVALFVGDSFTQPSPTFYPSITCAALDWICHVDGEGATGYAHNGHELNKRNAPYGARIDYNRQEYDPTVIVVTGGRNDLGNPMPEVQKAVKAYYRDLHRQFPTATIVAVEPFWSDKYTPPEMYSLRRYIKAAVKDVGGMYLPTSGWLRPSLIGDDGEHPTDDGYSEIASRMVHAFRKANIGGSADVKAP